MKSRMRGKFLWQSLQSLPKAQLRSFSNLERRWEWRPSGKDWWREVMAESKARQIHTLTLHEKEHLLLRSCINTMGESIPNFYVFKGKQTCDNYILKCDIGSFMAMKARTWVRGFCSQNGWKWTRGNAKPSKLVWEDAKKIKVALKENKALNYNGRQKCVLKLSLWIREPPM